MGLNKNIIANNGIPLSYHRIKMISCYLNHSNIIEVGSYINKEAHREEERSRIKDELTRVFIQTTCYNVDYNSNMTVNEAYNYLKTLPEFEGAEDDDEEVYLSVMEEFAANANTE